MLDEIFSKSGNWCPDPHLGFFPVGLWMAHLASKNSSRNRSRCTVHTECIILWKNGVIFTPRQPLLVSFAQRASLPSSMRRDLISEPRIFDGQLYLAQNLYPARC